MMRRNESWKITLLSPLALLMTLSCGMGTSYSSPPPTLQDSDLAGVWIADYRGHEGHGNPWARVTSIETLTLRADGMYQQSYDDGRGQVQTSPWNEWWVERFPDGAARVHLKGGRFYPSEVQSGERIVYHSYSDDGTGHPLDLNGTEVVLIVKASSRTPEEIYLAYPPVGDPDSPIIVTFYHADARAPTP